MMVPRVSRIHQLLVVYPLVICYIAIENDHRNSGFFMIFPFNMVDLSIVFCKRLPGRVTPRTINQSRAGALRQCGAFFLKVSLDDHGGSMTKPQIGSVF